MLMEVNDVIVNLIRKEDSLVTSQKMRFEDSQ